MSNDNMTVQEIKEILTRFNVISADADLGLQDALALLDQLNADLQAPASPWQPPEGVESWEH